MKQYKDLDLGFSDAINYSKPENKELLNRFFYKDQSLEELMNSNKYFLIGAKGTGKTALAVYLANNEYKNTYSSINYIKETEYVKFINLKRLHNLQLSDYTNVWKVLIMLLMSKEVEHGEAILSQLKNFSEFECLRKAVDEFYKRAFSPEIVTAFNIVEESYQAVKAFSEVFELDGSNSISESKEGKSFQLNLLSLENYFKKGLGGLKLTKNHILFIDGIDIRPRNIEYEEYLECVRGLANALWELNTGFFSKIKGRKSTQGRLRIVVLLRPDIFSHLGLQNLNTKIRDNGVLLNWNTKYDSYKTSPLYALTNRMLEVQQDSEDLQKDCWEYYFPYGVKNLWRTSTFSTEESLDPSFVSFLRFSWSRPRDIVSIMKIVQDKITKSPDNTKMQVSVADFDDSLVRLEISNYLLGEIKDYLSFYHSDSDYELFLKFFTFLDGKQEFSYDDYINAYEKLAVYIESNNIQVPVLFETSGNFLQFLYDLDVICYLQETLDGQQRFWHWSYRERSYANVNPKVVEGVDYRIHNGLRSVLSVGKRCKTRSIKKVKNL